jgi:hypothetical protein
MGLELNSWIAPTATIVAAIIAALLAYGNNARLHRSQETLKRVNAQIGDFYGPLFSISEASEAAGHAFRSQVRPGKEYFFARELTSAEQDKWESWITTVFMPANRRMYEILISHSHLIVDDMPQAFLDFCAHVSCYEVILHSWEQGDYTELNSVLRFPDGFREQIRNDFFRLKERQRVLLRQVHEGK